MKGWGDGPGGPSGSSLGLLRPTFTEAASSATRDERIEVSIWAEEVEAASLAATAAAADLLLSSSAEAENGEWVVAGGGGGGDGFPAGWLINGGPEPAYFLEKKVKDQHQ
ncbi:FAD-binding Berberine family protein [Striga asiatica]|uniref:FAD-binding Berberine family protein n=1 Tax=Striga asiatica TaxID=4170 RepID=A0A5A7P0G4_STRAF|nr:FAD-binding Berberine family protein [Striga asiatica]